MAKNLQNRAQITFNGSSGAVLSNETNTTLVDRDTIELTKAAVVGEVGEGADAVYVVRLDNTGSGNLYNPVIKDDLGGYPNKLEYVEGSALFFKNGDPIMGEVDVEDEHVKFEVDTVLEPGDSLMIIYAATVNEKGCKCEEITNKVKAKVHTCSPYGPVIKEKACETITVVGCEDSANVSIFKDASEDTVMTGDTLTYTFTLMNTGKETAEDINFTDELPEQFEVNAVSYTANGVTTPIDASDYTIENPNTLIIPAAGSSLELDIPAATNEGPGVTVITVTGTING